MSQTSKIKVLVVDDSVVYRSQIKAALQSSSEIEVVGIANNGKIALEKLTQLSVDVITLDMEMPELDGLETIREIKKRNIPVKIIVFSAYTQKGSEKAINALSLGADDIVPKPDGNQGSMSAGEKLTQDLIPKVLQFKSTEDSGPRLVQKSSSPSANSGARTAAPSVLHFSLESFRPDVIVIGSSTGGPKALEDLFTGIPVKFSMPILITQHMPPVFTASLAKRIAMVTGVTCDEGRHGEILEKGRIYVAPGDFHMVLERVDDKVRVVLNQNSQRNCVRPAVDYLFESASKLFVRKTLGIVLTGMGQDGLEGAKAIKGHGGGIAIQSKESCVVFGMPGAIFQEELQDYMGDILKLNGLLKHILSA